MHGLDPGLTQFEFDIEGEVRCVDTDKDVRFFCNQGLDQQFAPSQQLAQAPQHFHQPHDRQTLHGKVGSQAFGLHQRAADPNEFNGWMLRLDGAHQASAEDIAGSFSGHQCNTQRGHDQRVMPRVDAWIESRKMATSGNSAAGSASSASAWSTVSPWRYTTL